MKSQIGATTAPSRGGRAVVAGLIAAALGWAVPGAHAAEAGLGARPGQWSAGVIAGEALNHNLVDLLPKAVSGQLDFEPARVAGLVVRRGMAPPGWLADWGQAQDVGISTSLELTLWQAHGLADNTELALDWRPGLTPWQWGPVSLEFAWGVGVSHSFGQPWSDYTDPDRPQGHRTLFHMAPEVVLRHQGLWGDAALSLRIHHRSGLYGVFGPRRVGSNHLALVLMLAF